MKIYRKLQKKASKEASLRHYDTVVSSIERILGSGPLDPKFYEEADDYAEKYLAYNLRRKEASPFNVEVDETARRAETLNGFLLRETVNARINREETFGYDITSNTYKSDLLGLSTLIEARDIVHEILHSRPNYNAIIEQGDFGFGASATLRRRDAQRPRKFQHGLSATRDLLPVVEHLIAGSPIWTHIKDLYNRTFICDPFGTTTNVPDKVKTVSGAVLDFVPKDAKIDRIILKEPDLNGYIQKGIGKEIRRLLQRYKKYTPDGVDLNYSGDLNSELARAGSLDGHIATVDAERASDSITIALCEFILPPLWFNLLMKCRSPYALIEGRHHRLEMMSGMGNGFTFELESVIFYAIGLASARYSKYPFAERYVSIHGDDLTIPSDVFLRVRAAYMAAGINVNDEKSFFDGPFRESCGGHFFNGRSVKPFFVKTANGSNRGDWFWLANSLLLWLIERQPGYLHTAKGYDLFQVLLHLRHYAVNHDKRDFWYRTSFDMSRRSGLYGVPPKLRGAFYKVRILMDIPRISKYSDVQAYIAWLHSPKVTEPIRDYVLGGQKPMSTYEFQEEVDERDRTVRISRWTVPETVPGWPPLWAMLEHHKGL